MGQARRGGRRPRAGRGPDGGAQAHPYVSNTDTIPIRQCVIGCRASPRRSGAFRTAPNFYIRGLRPSMTTSDDLFQLIQSLKQTEKRYFKIFASIHVKGEQNNYVKLFDAIDKQEAYDEQQLLRTFQGENFIKQFAVTKNYLYNFILRSLRAYHSGSDAESRIQEEVESIKILFGKGLYKKCVKLVRKAKKLAREFDKYELLLHLIKWENEINTRYLKGDKLDEFRRASNGEIRETLEIMEEKYQLRLLEQEAFRVYRRYTRARSRDDLADIEGILAHPAMAEGSLPRSFISKLRYYNVKGVYQTLLGNHDKAHQYDQLRFRLFEENPHFIRENLIQYIKVQNNLLHNYQELEDWAAFEEILANVRRTADQYSANITNTEQAIIFETSYVQELQHYFRRKRFDQAMELLPRVEEMLRRYDEVIVIEFKIDILFTIAKIHFYRDDLDQALDWVNRIIIEDKPSAADDVVCFARILNLLIHFGLGNHDLLRYEIKSTRRFLTKKKRLFQVEDLLLRTLNRLAGQYDADKRRALYEAFGEQLDAILEETYEGNAMRYLNLRLWLRHRLEDKPLYELAMAGDAEL
jgi:hypothetical protein